MTRHTYTHQYGTLTLGVPYLHGQGADRRWIRCDHWESATPTGESGGQITYVAGPEDLTDVHPHWGPGYNPRCSCCWLGITHTTACHQDNLAAYEQSVTAHRAAQDAAKENDNA